MLFLELTSSQEITVRSLRTFSLHAGLYCYLGSAMGSGGLVTRLRRHSSESTRKHWHIDYLVPHVKQAGALVVQSADHLECRWASWAIRFGAECVTGFGASDCKCSGHLFRIDNGLGVGRISQLAQNDLGSSIVSRDEIAILGPNTSFQRARVRGGRGPGPLNSKR